jgi:precorrin-6B C5,15-methyltransferase / cobalt-precorrin-6B C5,C15-methyltransferase
LWDIGTGCGSVAIEWMRAARYARAIGIEPRADRRAMAAANALALGAPQLQLIEGEAPAALEGLPAPDAIFVGGGPDGGGVRGCFCRPAPAGPDRGECGDAGECRCADRFARARHGGDLVTLSVSRAEPVGRLTGWRPQMPVTQWSLIKR